MQKYIKKSIALNKNQYKESIDVELFFNDECPLCHKGIDMSQSSTYCYHDYCNEPHRHFYVICVHVCPSCHRSFITRHEIYDQCRNNLYDANQTVYPFDFETPNEIAYIRNISPDFIEITREAIVAKENELNKIYGMALRKSVECLVKDYALYTHPNDEQKITECGLGRCINDYINDSGIQSIAHSCRLIGNNETHWKNKNTKDDIHLMEKFINALVNYIIMNQTILEAQTYMNNQNSE